MNKKDFNFNKERCMHKCQLKYNVMALMEQLIVNILLKEMGMSDSFSNFHIHISYHPFQHKMDGNERTLKNMPHIMYNHDS